MTMTTKRVEQLELAVLDCLNLIEAAPRACRVSRQLQAGCALDPCVTGIFHVLEDAVGLNSQHLQSPAAKQRVKKPVPAARVPEATETQGE